MFRTKEVKRQLEQADVWKEQAERLRRTLAGIGERLTEAQIDVDQIGMSAAKMDRSLTKVVDGAKETKEEQEGAKETLRGLCDEIRDMDAQFALLGKAYDAQREFANEQQKALKDLMEQSKHYTGFSKTADDTALKSGETLQQIARSAEEMNADPARQPLLAVRDRRGAARRRRPCLCADRGDDPAVGGGTFRTDGSDPRADRRESAPVSGADADAPQIHLPCAGQ